MQKHFNDKRIAFLANGVRAIGPLDAKKKKKRKDLDLYPKPCTNNNSNKSHSEI